MGRKRVFRKEPTSTLSCYAADAMLVDDEQRGDEKSKADTLRRIFIHYFGEDRINAKLEEIQKKWDRQLFLSGNTGDQSTIDNMYYEKKSYKDMEWSRADLIELRLQSKPSEHPLARRNADDSISKAIQRGDCKETEPGKYIIVRKWF